MYYIPFSAMEQMRLIFTFSPPSSARACVLFKHKGCPCMETVINLFPLALPVTLRSAAEFGKRRTPGRDGSAEIPKLPGAAYTNAYDREEVSCGICGFCDGQSCELFHSCFCPFDPFE